MPFIQFITLKYTYKKPEGIDEIEEQRQLALIAMHDCASLARLIEQTTALISGEDKLPQHVSGGALLDGFSALGRILAGITDQAIAAIEELGEILEEGPRQTAATVLPIDEEDPLHEITQEIRTELSLARRAAA